MGLSKILILILAGLRAATSILLYHLLKDVIAKPIAMLGALYWALDQHIHWTMYKQGLETGVCEATMLSSLKQG